MTDPFLNEKLPEVEFSPCPASAPPPQSAGYGPVFVSDELISIFIPHMGLCSNIERAGQCYLADLMVDGKAETQIVAIVREGKDNLLALDWIKHGHLVSLWIGKQIGLTYQPDDIMAISQEYLGIMAAGMVNTEEVRRLNKNG